MTQNIELKDVRSFMQIARSGSLTRAAREANVPKATLSHGLQRLEDTLGVQLFIRSAKGLTLTDAGQAYLENSSRIFESCDAAASAAQQAHSTINGRVRIAIAAEFGTSLVGAATYNLSRHFPSMQFDVRLYPSDTALLEQADFDCMIHVGTPPNSSLMWRKLGTVSYGVYAAPNFLTMHGASSTRSNEELLLGVAFGLLPGVSFMRGGIAQNWQVSKGDKHKSVSHSSRFVVNDYWMAKFYAVKSAAMAYLPDFFVEYEVAAGALVDLLPAWRSEPTDVSILYPPSRHRNPRVKMLVDTLQKEFDEIIREPGYEFTLEQKLSGAETV